MDMDRYNPHTGGILLIIDRVVVLNRNSWRYKWAEKSCLRQALISRIRSVRLVVFQHQWDLYYYKISGNLDYVKSTSLQKSRINRLKQYVCRYYWLKYCQFLSLLDYWFVVTSVTMPSALLSSGISQVDLILISVDMVNYGAEFTMHYYLEIIFGKRT